MQCSLHVLDCSLMSSSVDASLAHAGLDEQFSECEFTAYRVTLAQQLMKRLRDYRAQA